MHYLIWTTANKASVLTGKYMYLLSAGVDFCVLNNAYIFHVFSACSEIIPIFECTRATCIVCLLM